MSLVTHDNPPRKAYSYVRFSTPEQEKGDSFRRQTQQAADYAARKGLQLDDTLRLHDLGVSAYRGANAAEGKLAAFIEAVRSGEVPQGSVLLVESLDRISRDNVFYAQTLLSNIITLGVSVVTLIDENEYSLATVTANPLALIQSVIMFMRANEESATKSRRGKEAWAAKRSKLDTKALTSKVPAWIELDRDSGELRLIPERAAIVERIYRDTLAGIGQHQIAANLNREGVKPWGRGKFWQRSYIVKILDGEATIGAFTPHTVEHVDGKRVRVPQGRIADYFPPAISHELWADVRAFRDGKHSRSRGRHASAPITNMLAGLAVCPLCGGTMTRTNKGSRSRPAYVCVRAKNKAGCSYRTVRVEYVEDAILTRLPERLRDAPAGERDPQLDRELTDAEGALEEGGQRIETILQAIERGGDAVSLSARLREREADYDAARAKVRELEGRRAAVAGATVHARIARLLEALEQEEGQPEAGAVNVALQTVFERVTVDYRHGVLVFAWEHGGDVEVPYALPKA